MSVKLESCTWRIEKNKDYLIGCIDEDKNIIRNELSALIGKKLEQIDIANSMMDARFQFEDGYILKTFTCCGIIDQWKVYSKNKPIFSASIPLSNLNSIR